MAHFPCDDTKSKLGLMTRSAWLLQCCIGGDNKIEGVAMNRLLTLLSFSGNICCKSQSVTDLMKVLLGYF